MFETESCLTVSFYISVFIITVFNLLKDDLLKYFFQVSLGKACTDISKSYYIIQVKFIKNKIHI